MNENLNLVEILKDCPKGTKLYSTVFGEVELVRIYIDDDVYPIKIKTGEGSDMISVITNDGRLLEEFSGECILFPSKEQRDWSKFKKPKFDPMTLKPFDKVLVRDSDVGYWKVQLFSCIIKDEELYPYMCINEPFTYCIPCNDDTKYLVGTDKEAPELYRYWED